MRRTRSHLALAFVFWSLSGAALAAPRTVGIVIDAHCTDATHVCGATTEQGFRDAAEQAVLDLNRYWEETEISFRLQSVTVSYGGDWLSITNAAGDPGEEDQLALINQLRGTAAADPEHVYFFVLQNLGFCFSGIPGADQGRSPSPKAPDEYYGVFCMGVDGNTMAHELGHHFCLVHPFTHADPVNGATVNHDADGFWDTPPDPGEVEYRFVADDADDKTAADVVYTNWGSMCNHDPESCAIQVNGNREWCGWTSIPSDPGSYRPAHCTPLCRKTDAAGLSQGTGYTPDTNLIMSYYKGTCAGPYVHAGILHGAFSAQERERISECAQGPERGALIDVCDNKGGDRDRDGLCDIEDPCPEHHASIYVNDADGDGTPDACDLCPNDPGETVDTDGDGAGDLCDTDDDGDGCLDVNDEHPLSAKIAVGTLVSPDCPGDGTVWAWEGGDADEDGIRDCEDPDNDNDGVIDEQDECPNSPEDVCFMVGPDCGLQVPWATYFGDCCQPDLMLRIESITQVVTNPRVAEVRMAGDVLVAVPPATKSAAEVAGWFSGAGFGLVEQGEKLRLDLVSKETGEVVTELGQYGLFSMEDAGFGEGRVVTVEYLGEVARGTMSLRIGTAWSAGSAPGADLPDGDGDGVPDLADVCLETPNPRQRDTDQDGIGDACDPDLDGDGAVTAQDLDRFEACLGALDPPPILPEEEQAPADDALRELSIRSHLCRGTDMDGDGEVTEEDIDRAQEWLGKAPGPSGMVEALPEPEPNPEPSPEHWDDVVWEVGPESGEDVVFAPEPFEVIGELPAPGPETVVPGDDTVVPGQDVVPEATDGEKRGGCTAGAAPGSAWVLLLFTGLILGLRRRARGVVGHRRTLPW